MKTGTGFLLGGVGGVGGMAAGECWQAKGLVRD